MNTVKKKIKKWIIGILISILPWILAAVVVLSGIGAITSFFKNLFSWGEKENIDINNCTIEELIDAVDDKDIFTKEVLDEMMIDRKSFKRLLKGINDYNNREEKAEISVEVSVVYTVEEEVEVEEVDPVKGETDNVSDEVEEDKSSSTDESGNEKKPKTEIIQVTYNETRNMDVVVSNNQFIRSHLMDWQTLYIMCLFRSMNNSENWVPEEILIDEEGNEVVREAIKLSNNDVDSIIDDFEHNFVYLYNSVEGPSSYTMQEAMSVPHDEFSTTEVKDGITYYISGYIPKSEISMVIAPNYIDMYSSGNISTYSLENTFIDKGNNYYAGFTILHFLSLMENLPGGVSVAETYRYIFNLAKWSEINE